MFAVAGFYQDIPFVFLSAYKAKRSLLSFSVVSYTSDSQISFERYPFRTALDSTYTAFASDLISRQVLSDIDYLITADPPKPIFTKPYKGLLISILSTMVLQLGLSQLLARGSNGWNNFPTVSLFFNALLAQQKLERALRLTRIKMELNFNIFESNISLDRTLFRAQEMFYYSTLSNIIFTRNVRRNDCINRLRIGGIPCGITF